MLPGDAEVCAVHSGRLMASRTRMRKLPEPIMAEGNEDVTEQNCRHCRREQPEKDPDCVILYRLKNIVMDALERQSRMHLARSSVLQRVPALWLPRRPPTDCCSRAIAAGNDEVGRPFLRQADAHDLDGRYDDERGQAMSSTSALQSMSRGGCARRTRLMFV